MEKSRRPADFLTIDPSSTFMTATSSRNFEELPENFLESANSPLGQGNGNDGSASSPQLASLTPMAMSSSDQSTSYQYGMKDDSGMGGGPAGLLSPLHLDRRSSSTTYSQRNSGIYIKEEDGLDGSPPQHLLMSSMHGQQDLDRNDATPPAVSNVELASTMITTILGDQASPVSSSALPPPPPAANNMTSAAAAALGQAVRRPSIAGSLNGLQQDLKVDQDELGMMNGTGRHNGDDLGYRGYQAATSSRAPVPPPKRVYSINDANDPLNAEIDDDIYIDTKDLCKRIAYELKQHSIPQAIFAERILCRSQGTLSDLLRNPKPWNKLKSGRETFRRMFNWVQQPLAMRLGILDMYNKEVNALEKAAAVPTGIPMPPSGGSNGLGPGGASAAAVAAAAAAAAAAGNSGLSPPTPAQNVRHHRRYDISSMGEDGQPQNKRPRLVFTDIQKRTLQAIFKETQRPSREMQQTIAEHLRLDLSTVANFFMNARRRSRLSHDEEPLQPVQPYQQVVDPSLIPTGAALDALIEEHRVAERALRARREAAAARVKAANKAAAAAAALDPSSPGARPCPSFRPITASKSYIVRDPLTPPPYVAYPSASAFSSQLAVSTAVAAAVAKNKEQRPRSQHTTTSSSAGSSPMTSPGPPLARLLVPRVINDDDAPPVLEQQAPVPLRIRPTTAAAALRAANASLAPRALPRKVFIARPGGFRLVPASKRLVAIVPPSQKQPQAAAPTAAAAAVPAVAVAAAEPPQPTTPPAKAEKSDGSILTLSPEELVASIPQFAGIPMETLAQAMAQLQQNKDGDPSTVTSSEDGSKN